MTEQLFRDNTNIALFHIPVTKVNDSSNNDDVDDACSSRIFTIIQHRLDYAFITRLLLIALIMTLVIVCITDSIARFNTNSIRRLTQTLVITLNLLRISNLLCS